MTEEFPAEEELLQELRDEVPPGDHTATITSFNAVKELVSGRGWYIQIELEVNNRKFSGYLVGYLSTMAFIRASALWWVGKQVPIKLTYRELHGWNPLSKRRYPEVKILWEQIK